MPAFRKGLNQTGYVEGKKRDGRVPLGGGPIRSPAGAASRSGPPPRDRDRRWDVARCARGQSRDRATIPIPIVFGIDEDPVPLGLVASLARPGGNATGVNFFVQEVLGKRLLLLHDLVPKAVRIAVLVNPANATITETTLREVQEAARVIGLQKVAPIIAPVLWPVFLCQRRRFALLRIRRGRHLASRRHLC